MHEGYVMAECISDGNQEEFRFECLQIISDMHAYSPNERRRRSGLLTCGNGHEKGLKDRSRGNNPGIWTQD